MANTDKGGMETYRFFNFAPIRTTCYTLPMSEAVLYRKYRPSTFKDVLGQDHIVRVLESELKSKKIAHAYLFTGSRGTGKTSVARILAAGLGATKNDIYEIDGASYRKIDHMRELREMVQTLPLESPYKVYIIDEVHMLTLEAFNALLKTLEEPPAHVIFILATTELHKVPATIISRCQNFTFKKPSQRLLKEMATTIAKKEGVTLDSSSADLIALMGDGSFRDTQGVLQKVLNASANQKLAIKDVEEVLGAPTNAIVHDVIRALKDQDLEKGIGAIRIAGDNNVDMDIFLKLITHKLRLVFLMRFDAGWKKRVEDEYVEDEVKFLSEMSEAVGKTLSSSVLLEMLEAHDQMRFASVPELPLELALMRVLEEKK